MSTTFDNNKWLNYEPIPNGVQQLYIKTEDDVVVINRIKTSEQPRSARLIPPHAIARADSTLSATECS